MKYSRPICSEQPAGLRIALFMLALYFTPELTSAFAVDSSKPSPAKLEGTVKETELAKITLLPEAAQRLGIQTAVAEGRTVQRTRIFGGEVVVPQGQSITLTAPLTGRLKSPETGPCVPGANVSRGQPIFRLLPVLGSDEEVLSPSDRISLLRASVDIDAATVESEGQVTKAQVAVDAAKVKLARAEELQERNAGSARAVEEARAELDSAQASLRAAERRREFLQHVSINPDNASVPDLAIQSPIDGVLRQVTVADNQVVTAGTPLFSVFNRELVWIRVPVYVGEAPMIHASTANVTIPGSANVDLNETATRAVAPPSANAASATTDIFYELSNRSGKLVPGQRVLVTVPIGDPVDRLTVPASAIVYDIHGGAWVYEQIESHVFARRRVELERMAGSSAILRRGLQPGTTVVTSGAAELYGTEFGVGK